VIRFAGVQFAIAGFLACTSVLSAQKDRPDACPATPSVAPRTEAQKQEARKLAEQARQAAIVDGSDAARDLFKRSVELDPTDPNTVYALARSYDAAKEMESAIVEYCRFLSLSPVAPEASDVRRRITTRAEDIPKSQRDVTTDARDTAGSAANNTVANTPVQSQPVAPAVPIPSSVTPASSASTIPSESQTGPSGPKSPNDLMFALAPFVPGLGQYATHRPFLGLIVTASSLGALYMGLKPEYKTVTVVPTNPGGPTTMVKKDRPNLAIGVTLAMGISMLAELESYLHGHGSGRQAQPSRRSTVVTVTPDGGTVGVGVAVAFR
jgi:hypothetical protein